MTPHEAVDAAKSYVVDLFGAEGATNVGLEELRFDSDHLQWLVTVGFSRSWEGPQASSRWIEHEGRSWPRTFKTVAISDVDGRVLELRHWPVAA